MKSGITRAAVLIVTGWVLAFAPQTAFSQQSEPSPLLQQGHPVDWWFVFKLNVGIFPGCNDNKERECPFGGKTSFPHGAIGQQFVFASSDDHTLQNGHDCIGDETTDPVGATFAEVYNGTLNYVLWNDQFYGDPIPDDSCTLGDGHACDGPWGHSKGMVAWNDAGQGFVMQVTTPDWPGSGSSQHERERGNTLGCTKDNNVAYSQSFFALKLTKEDLKFVLAALRKASVATNPNDPQIVRNGGPQDVQALVSELGKKVRDKKVLKETLSSGVVLIAKPSSLHVPPWQMVSAVLNSVPLRVASWRGSGNYGSTSSSSAIGCWDDSLAAPGDVQIATSGSWENKAFSLNAFGTGHDGNHAKIAVSTGGGHPYSIFGDENEQGNLSGTSSECKVSQNGRGGLFFVVDDQALHDSVADLIAGESAPPE